MEGGPFSRRKQMGNPLCYIALSRSCLKAAVAQYVVSVRLQVDVHAELPVPPTPGSSPITSSRLSTDIDRVAQAFASLISDLALRSA